MALKDDITALPTTVGEGSAGHLGNHATLHAAAKNHETRITTAEANKADKTTLDTRVPSNMALRLDTTVGTRIFAGDTMIHGDTGWRSATTLLYPDVDGSISIIRTGQIVTVIGTNVRPPKTGSVQILDMPLGFRASRAVVGTAAEVSDTRPVFASSTAPHTVEIRNIQEAQSWINFTITFVTRDPWPTTLPGLPV